MVTCKPQRMCVVCRQHIDKDRLIRIVVDDSKQAMVDISGKQQCRGIYICKNDNCISKLLKTKNLEKRYGFAIDTELAAQLEGLFDK